MALHLVAEDFTIGIELSEKRSSMWIIPVHIRVQLLAGSWNDFSMSSAVAIQRRHFLPQSSMQYAARNVSDHRAAHERISDVVEIIAVDGELNISACFSRAAFPTLLNPI